MKHLVNYPALKDGASNFTGISRDGGFTASSLANNASISSTGDSRRYQTVRFTADVLGGVHVSIVQRATFLASPSADIQGHFCLFMQTVRAYFAGRKVSIGFDISLACPSSFIGKEGRKYAPPRIANGFGQAVVFHHSFDMQILDGDHLVFVHDSIG
jgi:hypothetical protein